MDVSEDANQPIVGVLNGVEDAKFKRFIVGQDDIKKPNAMVNWSNFQNFPNIFTPVLGEYVDQDVL